MNKPIHILQVVHSLAIGGTERVVCDLVRNFNDGEFRSSVCCLDELGEFGEGLRENGIPVHVLDRKPGLDFSLTSRLRRLYHRENVDVVHAHQYTPYFYASTAAFRAGMMPVIFTEHGRHWPDRFRIKRAVMNQLLRLTTAAYTAVSEFSRRSLIDYERIPAVAVQVIYNGIDPTEGHNEIDSREKIRSEAGLTNEDLLILSVGRMDPIKDFGTLIRAFAFVEKELPRASLWIAGDGDAAYKRQLTQLVEELELTNKIKLLGARRDVNRLLYGSDLFVLSSVTEATSMTILEAMAAGVAVLATDTGGNPELIIPDKTGMLVPVGEVAGMGKAMEFLLHDDERRKRIGEAGKHRIREKFSKELSVAQYRNLYRSIAQKQCGSPFRWMTKSPFASHI
jgi:sugar transferase (PEP-CTERM/EpsH1 system associated)